MSVRSAIKAENFRALKNNVFVHDMEAGPQKTFGGIIIPDDNMKDSGVHPRWAQVYAVGPDVEDLVPGDWILVKHGRWTLGIDLDFPGTGITRLWRVEYPESVELASATDPRNKVQTTL